MEWLFNPKQITPQRREEREGETKNFAPFAS